MDAPVISDIKHHCAAPTWNGFVYQGKIALIVVLDFLLGDDQDWEEYGLELEWREDFSIKRQERHLSIHQVKCKIASGLGEYQEAIDKLRANIYQAECEGGPIAPPVMYLHTASIIPSLDGDDVKMYDYGEGECSMPIEHVDKALQNRIQRYLDKVDPGNSGSRGKAFYELCHLHVSNIVTAKIQEIHRINHTGVSLTGISKLIAFEEIIGLLRKDHNANSLDYYTFKLKQTFNEAFENFFFDNDITEEADSELFKKLCNYSSLINCLNDSNFRRFCLAILPNAELEKESGFPKLHADSITDAFCDVLSQVSLLATIAENDHKLLYHKGGTNYLPSSIGSLVPKKRVIEGLRRNIHNDDFLEVLFEVKIIVSKNVSFTSLQEELGNILQVPDPDNITGIRIREKINQIQDIEMIDLDTAKQRIDIDTND